MECENWAIPNPNSEGSAENGCPHHGEIDHDLESLRGRQYHEGVVVSVHDQRVVLPHSGNEASDLSHFLSFASERGCNTKDARSTLDHWMKRGDLRLSLLN